MSSTLSSSCIRAASISAIQLLGRSSVRCSAGTYGYCPLLPAVVQFKSQMLNRQNSLFALSASSVALGEGHVNIIRPHELLLTTSHLVLVTQCGVQPLPPTLSSSLSCLKVTYRDHCVPISCRYSDGGSLNDYFSSHPRSEDTISFFFLQFASALSYCHRKVPPRPKRISPPPSALISAFRAGPSRLCVLSPTCRLCPLAEVSVQNCHRQLSNATGLRLLAGRRLSRRQAR